MCYVLLWFMTGLWGPKAQLGIQVHVVVPGQPIDGIQLAVWQRHHLREAGGKVVDLVDHTLRSDNGNSALDLHGTIIHVGATHAQALPRTKDIWIRNIRRITTADFLSTHERSEERRVGNGNIPKAQLGIQVNVVVPGQPIDGIQLAVWQRHHLREAGGKVVDLVDHTLRSDNGNSALDLHGTIIHVGATHAQALPRIKDIWIRNIRRITTADFLSTHE